ncbi:MAG: hypothetical protein ACPLXC_02635 [Candidatus Pacearchaeota archaeon]
MKKSPFLTALYFAFIVLALISQNAKADESEIAAFSFEKVTITDVCAKELSIPARFNLTINNTNIYDDHFRVYSLIDLKIMPIAPIFIPARNSITIELKALPLRWLKEKGLHSMEYYIKGDKSGYKTDTVLVKVLPLSEILTVTAPATISRDDTKLTIRVANKENINLGDAQVSLNSELFSATKNITIAPKSEQNIILDLNPTALKVAKAGDYPVKIIFFLNNEYNHTVESLITLQEYSNIATEESSKFKFFGFTKIIKKKNEGNIPKLVTIEVVKNRFERIFSSFNIPPTSEKPALIITTLSWQRELEPGETLEVQINTDYTIPTLILIALIVAIVLLYLAKRPRVVVKKKAIRLHTKSDEFALKIIVFVKNIGKEVQSATLTDRLPNMAKLYEKFAVKPDKIELPRLEWNFGSLAAGEERVVSYIIYSKIMPVGSIELPQSSVHYTDSKERRRVSYSNKLFVTGVPSKA